MNKDKKKRTERSTEEHEGKDAAPKSPKKDEDKKNRSEKRTEKRTEEDEGKDVAPTSPKKDEDKKNRSEKRTEEDEGKDVAPKSSKKDAGKKNRSEKRSEKPTEEHEGKDVEPTSPKKDEDKKNRSEKRTEEDEGKDVAPKSSKKDAGKKNRSEKRSEKRTEEHEGKDVEPKSPKKDEDKKNRSEKRTEKRTERSTEEDEGKDVASKSRKDEGEDAMNVHSERPPFELVLEVKKFGRNPLYDYLLTKLDAFKQTKNYGRLAMDWDLIKIPKQERMYHPTKDDFANIPSQELYEKLMFGESQGNRDAAQQFEKFLLGELYDRHSWTCMRHFETMMKEIMTYEAFMERFKDNMEKIGERHYPFALENARACAALKECYDKYSDSTSGLPKQLSSKEKKESDKMWKEEMVRTDKATRNAHEKAAKAHEKAAKAQKKEKERTRFEVGGAPPPLLKNVKKFGRNPLYDYLLTKLDAFKQTKNYGRLAMDWDLIKIPKQERMYHPTKDDFANIPSQELYEKLMFGESQGNHEAAQQFEKFLLGELYDRHSWTCMRHFETMMKEIMTYEAFMERFKDNMEKIGERHYPFALENVRACAALKECYDKYKDLDLETARGQT
ncbi:hypothetical protein MHU86_5404 [Fragilaria crotonensis]|nr:hypothetical protein MHU86_5404 [Fragilaria crotonensis]